MRVNPFMALSGLRGLLASSVVSQCFLAAETESTQGLLTMSRAAVLAVRIERERLRQGEPGRIGPAYLNRTKDAEKVEPRPVNVSSGAP